MTDHLGSLARFAEEETVRQVHNLVIDNSWYQQDEALPVIVQYDNDYRNGLIRFSPHLDEIEVDAPHGCMTLSSREFMAVLVWLIRQGLLENVGLVSTETSSVGAGTDNASAVGATHASPVQDDDDTELDWPQRFRKQQPTETSSVGAGFKPAREGADEHDEEDEPETAPPFPLPLFELEQGAGDPEWVKNRRMMVYLHHELELSITDIARLCDTTYARVKSALHRLGIEIVSYRGAPSKIAPPPDGE